MLLAPLDILPFLDVYHEMSKKLIHLFHTYSTRKNLFNLLWNPQGDNNRLIFSKDLPKYKEMVRHFYQDVASMRPVSDQEMVKQMCNLSMSSTIGGAGKFDTNLALKELCVYAVNYGVELMNSLNGDCTCQQLELSQQLEQCFRSFTIFEAYR